MIPLYGYGSEETAYLVEDYPYGFHDRCRIRYWLEKSNSKGFRFCSQTENPKTKRWNNPKKSTYCKFAGAMFLDENNHVQWNGIGEYDEVQNTLDFVKNFPKADFSILKVWCLAKAIHCSKTLEKGEGSFGYKLNEQDIERYKADEKNWRDALELIKAYS